jgi:hypothetical protein
MLCGSSLSHPERRKFNNSMTYDGERISGEKPEQSEKAVVSVRTDGVEDADPITI